MKLYNFVPFGRPQSCTVITQLVVVLDVHQQYCRFGNFRENFIFANSIKRHTSDVKNSRIRQDFSISITTVILPFREGLFLRNFAYAKYREKLLAKISVFTVPKSV